MNETSAPTAKASQASFVETAYADSTWEIVGEIADDTSFLPLEVETIAGSKIANDPMFADYGGIPTGEVKRRWHLPEHLHAEAGKKAEEGENPKAAGISLTQEEFEQKLQEAFAEGVKKGSTDATQANAEKLTAIQKQFEQILKDLHAQQQESMGAIEQHAVKLALQISHKIIQTAVDINPEYIVGLVREALQQAGSSMVRKVRISPQDMEFMEVVGFSKGMKEFEGTWKFEADATIKSGCVVDTTAGEIDYQLESAWERVRDSIVKILK